MEAVVAPGALGDAVVAGRGEHLDPRERLVALAHRVDEPGVRAGGVGDDVGVDEVVLVLAVRLGHLVELTRGYVGREEPHVPGDGDGEPADGAALVDDHDRAPAGRGLGEHLPEGGLLLRDLPADERLLVVSLDGDDVVGGLADVDADEDAVGLDLGPVHVSPCLLDWAGLGVVLASAFCRILRAFAAATLLAISGAAGSGGMMG